MSEVEGFSEGTHTTKSTYNPNVSTTVGTLTLSEFIAKNSPESIILQKMRSQSPPFIPVIRRALFSPENFDLLEGLDRRKAADARLPRLTPWNPQKGGF